MTPSLSADVKLSYFISYLTEDGSHIKLRRVGLAVWGRGNIYRSGSNWVLHRGKQYCHEWFRAAESAKLLFGSPSGAILHFTHSKNKMLRLTDCKGDEKKGCGSPKMHQHILFPFYCGTGTQLGTAAKNPRCTKQDGHEVINCSAFGHDLWSIAAFSSAARRSRRGVSAHGWEWIANNNKLTPERKKEIKYLSN